MAQVNRPVLERYLVGRRQVPALGRFLDAFSEHVDLDSIKKGRSSIGEFPMITGLHIGMVGEVRPFHRIISKIDRAQRALGEPERVWLHYMVYRDAQVANQENEQDFHLVVSGNSFNISTSLGYVSVERFPYAAMLGSLQAAIMGPRQVSS